MQGFFAYRIRGISGRSQITIMCWSLSFLLLVWSTLIGTESIVAIDQVHYQARWSWLITTTLAVSVFVDVTIAASLSYYLLARKQYVYMR
jgi:hypothetical protein